MARTRLSSRVARVGALAALVGGALLAAPQAADAQVLQRFVLHGEGGAGYMLAGYQNTQLGQGLNIYGAGRLGFSIIEMLSIQAGYETAFFPVENRAGQQHAVTGGLRFEPRIGTLLRPFIDFNAGLSLTGPLQRFTFNAGLGLEFQLARGAVGIGPFARYTHTLATEADYPSDAMFISAGLSLSLRMPREEQAPPPADTDGDGVLDPDDQCVSEPQGANPDPERRGCPMRDTDGDGVFDNEDQCREQPMGEHPDPARRGCPLADTDGDGVFDNEDQCVTTPQGEHPDPARRGCPDGDDDGDGVFNSQDQCPRERPGINPDPARPGCPLPDRDRDTVPDATDACPDQPGAPSANPRRNGCPGDVAIQDGNIRITRPVFFATNRDTILPRSFPVLNSVAETLRLATGIRRVSIEGHTDDVGDDTANMDLSQRRANSVMTWLTQHGIEAGRLEAHGFGETRPTTPIAGLRGRALNTARGANRRVEFHIVDPAPAGGATGGAPAAAPAP